MEQKVDEISWSTLEYEEKDRHPDWIWYVALIAIIISVLSFFYKNIFFGIFSIIAGATVILMSYHTPKTLVITLSKKGIQINDQFFDYKNIISFWLDENDKKDKLLLLVNGYFIPMLSLPLEGVRAGDIREYLKDFTQETEIKESFGVKILERLGF